MKTIATYDIDRPNGKACHKISLHRPDHKGPFMTLWFTSAELSAVKQLLERLDDPGDRP